MPGEPLALHALGATSMGHGMPLAWDAGPPRGDGGRPLCA